MPCPVERVWTSEPKYDGTRALGEASSGHVRLMTRNGKDRDKDA
jgi:ATP-dependent DNA ligase